MPSRKNTRKMAWEPRLLARKTVSKKPVRADRFIRLSQGDVEALCVGMGLMAWEFAEARDVHTALQFKQHTAGRAHGLRIADVPWRYETITPMARLALQLYATGLFPLTEAIQTTHPGITPKQAKSAARVLLRKVQERHPATVRAMEEGYLSMKTPLDQLADARLEAAQESMAFLRKCLTDEEMPAEERVKIAQDFLDRSPETAKVSKNETRTTAVGGLQMPAEAAARLAAAADRASRYLLRSPEELTHAAQGTNLHEIPEADSRPLALGAGALEGGDPVPDPAGGTTPVQAVAEVDEPPDPEP